MTWRSLWFNSFCTRLKDVHAMSISAADETVSCSKKFGDFPSVNLVCSPHSSDITGKLQQCTN